MNRSIGFGQPIVPNPCHFPRYSEEPKEKAQRFREKWDPVSKRLVNCYFPLIAYVPPPSRAFYITTVAGNGTAAWSGDGGPAIQASLNTPTAICVDLSDNLYIVDRANTRIRKIDSTTGIINTIILTSRMTDTLFVDRNYNVYYGARSIILKKDNISGISTSFAGNTNSGYSGDGGLAINARVSYTSGLCMDSNGNSYFSDQGNERIRRVDSAGYIYAFAGTGVQGYNGDDIPATSADLRSPFGLCIDPLGNVCIADTYNNRIRKVGTDNYIRAFAGDGTPTYGGDNGPAINSQLNAPTSITYDSLGNMYIADSGNNVIRKVDSSGIITTVAGAGSADFSGDGGLATSAELSNPSSVCVDSKGNVYIADSLNNRIRKLYYA